MSDDYLTSLPSDDTIREGLSYAYDYWQNRNKFIQKVREMLAGQNKISAPTGTPYKIQTLHSFMLAAIINEKAARFTKLPVIQAVPEDYSTEARNKSSDIELAINMAIEEMERRSDGDVWGKVVIDAIALDEGVERIERAPAAFWPEVVTLRENNIIEPFEREKREEALKKQYGLPIRSIYVPLENFYPIYEGPTLVESFEVEVRKVRDVLRNPLFSLESKNLISGNVTGTGSEYRTEISIVHYVNSIWHAYYALIPSNSYSTPGENLFPNLTKTDLSSIGTPVLLYAYQHNLGESMYNCTAGRYGGWKSSNNIIEGVAQGMLELNQAADELFSQIRTNVRAKYWPTLLQKINPEMRGYSSGASEPKAPTIQEGQNLTIYIDESVEPLFKPVHDEMVPFIWDKISEQMGRLGGSPVIFGQNAPGVETGYHQALQITQSEHLDEKIEQHLSVGAINRANKILKHIKSMDMGEVYVHATEFNSVGKKTGKFYSLNPVDLVPLPRLDAQVRRPRPVDFAASLRAAREASDERQGKGPLLSDDTIRADLLSIQAPNQEEHKVLVQRQKNELIQSGVIGMKVQEALNLKLVEQSVPEVSEPERIPDALTAAAGQLKTPPPSTTPLPTGMPVGQSQPEQSTGTEIANSMFGA